MRLSRATLSRVPASARPLMYPGDCRAGVLHLGVGAFHRAHQAVYTEEAIAREGGDWAIVGVAPRRRTVADALNAQDGLFSVTSVDATTAQTRTVGSLMEVIHAPSDVDRVMRLFADPSISVVTLTITEKGYLFDPVTGAFTDDDQLSAELAGKAPPSSAPALVVRGLMARAQAGGAPMTVLSCDNLTSNGTRLRAAVGDAFEAVGADSEWLDANVTFPNTMVDRIVPASTAQTREIAATVLGVLDEAAVEAEPHREWIIEDDFAGDWPAWEAAGAVITSDVAPFERRKLRVLNGMHSMTAYLGAVAGRETIAEALQLPGMIDLLDRFARDDVTPTLRPPDGMPTHEYAHQCLDRFANPAINYGTRQVATDGSQKLAQRILPTVQDSRAGGEVPRWACLSIAAWMRLATGQGDDGRTLPLDDPLARDIVAARDAADPVAALLRLDAIFPRDIAEDETVREQIADWYSALTKHGVADVVAAAREGQGA